MKFFIENIENSKLTITCSVCGRLWMVGDRERSDEEKKMWICPNCVDKERAMESTLEQMHQEHE